MHRISSVLSLFILISVSTIGQGLYTPRDVQAAYKKGTRSPDGKPGKNYWQNYARYNINFTALPPDRNVKGSEQIAYVNNSPDTLKVLVIRLIVNIHKPGALRYTNASPDYLTEGVKIDAFAVNGQTKTFRDNPNTNTFKVVRLEKPLMPHDSIHLSFDWHYQISLESGREGMIDSTTYFMAYAYPRVSVYDDYNGWDTDEFTDQQEFYNDFNDYTFSVKAPKNYIVWATGDLLNPTEVLQPKFAQRLKESMTSDSVIHVATKADLDSKTVTAQNATNTWLWKADNVSDVTIGLSDHYVWDAGSVIVDDAKKRRASVQAAFNDNAADFHHMVEFGKHSLDWLSHNWPGIPYPFQKTTIFQGFADMEYPMMVNDGSQQDLNFSRFVAEHEIAHSWFPFYMGINEHRYGFMDEGWATTFELLIGRADLGVEKAENFYKQFRVQGWIKDPGMEEDLPIITPANVLINAAYGNNAYGKPSLGYLAVKDLLGDDLFKKCLHGYMDRWHGKHPFPWDFFYSFNDISGKNLNWFWNNWYFTNYYIDFAIQKADKTNSGYSVSIQNIGGYVAPVDIVVNYIDGTNESFHQTPGIWEKDQKTAIVNVATKKQVQSIQLKGGIFMDADESNNSWKAN
ncbi:MAG: aminopeptidase [Bacteroidetes bacterium]|nr:MAG: aminopeptidase [Bacteroidota bacterium]